LTLCKHQQKDHELPAIYGRSQPSRSLSHTHCDGALVRQGASWAHTCIHSSSRSHRSNLENSASTDSSHHVFYLDMISLYLSAFFMDYCIPNILNVPNVQILQYGHNFSFIPNVRAIWNV
jgi:hypothetical protein